MGHHILVPLDGSALAEGVLPHAVALGKVFNSQLTLLHVNQPASQLGQDGFMDPLQWQMQKAEASNYIKSKAEQLKTIHPTVDCFLAEGQPAEKIIEYGHSMNIDLIVLSSHGQSGLSEWNISSVVQKIIMRSKKSIFLVRAYKLPQVNLDKIFYHHVMVPLDCSRRAEFVLQLAVHLTQALKTNLLLTHVIQKPEIVCRMPISAEDQGLIDHLIARNEIEVGKYFDQLRAQLSVIGVNFSTLIQVRSDVAATLHEIVRQEQIDLVILTAHGHSGSSHWPYGSVATSFIVHGSTPLLIIQDLQPDEIEPSEAERAAQEHKGR